MKTIFAVKDKELGWVGFLTAEEAGEGATQINCYENLAEFNDAKLEKVRQGALAKLTEAEKAALGLTNFKIGSTASTPPPLGAHLAANPHSERIAKYNRLLEIEQEIGEGALFYW
jgi:hypothetical protein